MKAQVAGKSPGRAPQALVVTQVVLLHRLANRLVGGSTDLQLLNLLRFTILPFSRGACPDVFPAPYGGRLLLFVSL